MSSYPFSFALIQAQEVSHFHTAQSIQGSERKWGEKTIQTHKQKGRHRPDIREDWNKLRAHPLPGKR